MGGSIGRTAETAWLRRLLADDGPRAAVISGLAGVGKSHLLDDLARFAHQVGWSVERLYGSPGVRNIPFGAIAHLLPDAPTDPATAFHQARAELRRRSRGVRSFVAVDDFHDLDEASAALVHQIAAHDEARIALVVREGSRSAAASAVWKEKGVQRLDVGPLSVESFPALVAQILGGPPSDDLVTTLWERSLGHPLYVTIALQEAKDRGAVVSHGGGWALVADFDSIQLDDLIRSRMQGLGRSGAAAVEVVAVGEPLPATLLDAVVGAPTVRLLIDQGIVRSRDHDGVSQLTLAHPLYAEACTATLSASRRRRICTELVGAARVAGEEHVDVMRTALWMLDSDEPVDVAHAVRAANEALRRGNVAMAESLARSAMDADPGSVQATVVLAQSLAYQGRGDEAVAVLAAAEPSTAEDVTAAALVHGQVLAFVLGRADDAATMLERTAAQLPDAFRWQVDAERALYGAIAGDFSATFEAASAVLANEGASEEARIGAFVNLTLVQSVTGLLAELDGNVDAGLVAVDASPLPPPLAVEQLEMNRLHGWCAAGRLREAEHHSRARLASAERIGATSPMYLTWHSLMLGMRGQLVEAISAEQRALELFDGGDPLRLRPQALAMLAMHRTQAGQASVGSQQDLARARDASGAETRLLFWVDRATAWSLVADGTLEDAARYAVALGADALARDHIVWGIWALHDAARFGHPALALPAIRSATEQTTGAPLLAAMAAHASALAGGDADRLTVVATGLAAMGSPLFAAEASAQASRLREQAGDVVAACRAAFRSALWSDHCDGAATPALLDVAEGLTTREVEVARLVSAGAPSQAAAETLFVSVRTVDNHLRSIYRKLGVRGRGDLADIVLGIDEVGRS